MGYDYGYTDAMASNDIMATLGATYIIVAIFSLISSIAAIIVTSAIAKKKGRSGGWGWLAVAIGWIAVIIVACLPSENNNTTNTTNTYSNTTYSNTSFNNECNNCVNETQNKWMCKECNFVNDPNYNYCSNCGSKKPE